MLITIRFYLSFSFIYKSHWYDIYYLYELGNRRINLIFIDIWKTNDAFIWFEISIIKKWKGF